MMPDLVDQPVRLRPLSFHLLDVVALFGVRVGRDTDASAQADDVGRDIDVRRVQRVERHLLVMATWHHDIGQRVIVVRQKEIFPHIGDDLVGEDRHHGAKALG